MNTRERIRRFHHAFGRPVNEVLTNPSPEERLLRGKLLLEEVMETLTKGLGLQVIDLDGDVPRGIDLRLIPGLGCDLIETIDGLADINVIIHGSAHTFGFDLDMATAEVDDSNMSKLGADGQPIINGPAGTGRFDGNGEEQEQLMDPSKPVGKILKGPNYREPDFWHTMRAGNRPEPDLIYFLDAKGNAFYRGALSGTAE